MENDEILQKYQKAYMFLKTKSVYELRAYGRALGVQSPTTMKKDNLITEIIKIASGIEPKSTPTKKGARVRSKPITDAELKELRSMFQADIEPEPLEHESTPISDNQKMCEFSGELHYQDDGTFYLSVKGKIKAEKR